MLPQRGPRSCIVQRPCLSFPLSGDDVSGGRKGEEGTAAPHRSRWANIWRRWSLLCSGEEGGGGSNLTGVPRGRISPVCHAFVRFTDGAARCFCTDAPNCPPACPNFLPHFQFFLPVSRKRSITEQLKLFRLDSEVRCWSCHCRYYSHCRH